MNRHFLDEKLTRAVLTREDAFEEFRDIARTLIGAGVAPRDVTWRVSTPDLIGGKPPPQGAGAFSVPAAYVRLAEAAVCHRDRERFALLYELLWRITHGERELLSIASDPLVHRVSRMEKAVRRDMHKMTAFLRFRRIEDEGGEHFVAWFEPEHFILRRISDFFIGRFAAMRWSILTPQGAMHWDGKELTFSAGVSHKDAPAADALEEWWRTYYRATFNPARANAGAMRAEMPKKYWRNMPEADLIPGLLAEAESRTRDMVASPPTAPRHAKGVDMPKPEQHEGPDYRSLTAARKDAEHCTRCPLYKHATQTVFGEGPVHARRRVRRRTAGRSGGFAGQAVRRAGRADVRPRARRGRDRPVARLRHERRETLQVHAARQAPHPPEAEQQRDRGLPLVARQRA